jgi:hypothetical protein
VNGLTWADGGAGIEIAGCVILIVAAAYLAVQAFRRRP